MRHTLGEYVWLIVLLGGDFLSAKKSGSTRRSPAERWRNKRRAGDSKRVNRSWHFHEAPSGSENETFIPESAKA